MKVKCALVALLVIFASGGPAGAVPVKFGATGHFYDVIDSPGIGINWTDAMTAANSLSFMGTQGHLATITSLEENLFLTNTFGGNALHQHWLGGFQPPGSPEPAGGWSWVTGEPFIFDNWFPPFEPNNAFGIENFLAFDFVPLGVAGKFWNDLPDITILGYVVEYPVSGPIPEPGTLLLLGSGVVGMGAVARRRSRR